MKKFMSMILVLVLVVALAVPAFAEGNIADKDGLGSANQDITAGYTSLENKDGGKVYYVTIAWEAQQGNLAYSAGTTTYTWNGTSMKYEAEDAGEGAGWTGEATVKVTVTNQSNAEITATPSSKANYGLAVENGEALTLGSAAVKDGEAIAYTDTETAGVAQNGDITFTISPKADSVALDGENKVVATVTVTIAPVAESAEP